MNHLAYIRPGAGFSAMLAAAAGVALAASIAHAETTLTVGSWAPPNHLMTREVTQAWMAEAEKATSGRVKFRMLPKHPSSPPGTFDAVRDGLVDVSYSVPGYSPARHVLTLIAELPGSGKSSEINSVAYNRIHWKYLQQAGEFKGVKLLAVFSHGPGQMFNTKRAVNSLADMRGIKIRTGGGVAEQMAQALGASSFVKPSTESYELLSTGVADGVFFPLESVTAFKLENIVKFATLFPGGFYSATFGFIMNEEKWNKLAREDQDAIMKVSGEPLARAAGKAWDKADVAALEVLKKANVAITEASDALKKEIAEKAAKLDQDWIKAAGAKGVDGAKVLAEFRAELKKVEAVQ